MRQELLMSEIQVEQLFHLELVKCGIEYQKAAKAAKILATGEPDDLLTDEEKQLVEQVCKIWLENRNRWSSILQVLETRY